MRKEGDREVWPRREEKTAGAGGARGGAKGSDIKTWDAQGMLFCYSWRYIDFHYGERKVRCGPIGHWMPCWMSLEVFLEPRRACIVNTLQNLTRQGTGFSQPELMKSLKDRTVSKCSLFFQEYAIIPLTNVAKCRFQ